MVLFVYGMHMVFCLKIDIHILLRYWVLTFYHLIFGEKKRARSSYLKPLPKVLTSQLCFQASKRPPND